MRYEPDEDKPGLAERLVTAFESTDMSVSAERRGDADLIGALGMAQQHERVYGGAVRLLMSRKRTDLRRALQEATNLTVWMNARQNWRLASESCQAVAELAVRHYVDPTCGHCKGRGRDVPEGSPYLGANICKHCGGLGRRPIQKRWNHAIRAVLGVLEAEAERTLNATGRALR
jgi:hypothetical protein